MDIKSVFEETSGLKFDLFFRQWVQRRGAPKLSLQKAQAEKTTGGWSLTLSLSQTQLDSAYVLLIPVAIYLHGQKEAKIENLHMTVKNQVFTLTLSDRPLAVDIDPLFDVFRILDKNEIPPALSQIFGAEKVMIIIGAAENNQKREAYQKLAADWASTESKKFEIVMDNDLESIPGDRSVWLFGLNNRFKSAMITGLKAYDCDQSGNQIHIGQSSLDASQNSVIISTRNPQNPDHIIVWLCADPVEAIAGLGRKLPHYGKYSYLAFEGDEPTNILKGQWPAINSPMSTTLAYGEKPAGGIERGPLPLRPALAMLAPVFDEAQMKGHVDFLASESLQGRELGSKGLDKAADYIRAAFKNAGLEPGGDDSSYFQVWQEKTGRANKLIDLKNVIGFIPGQNKNWTDQAVIIGAHYDHLGLGWPEARKGNEGKIHFGADDNASGVAVLLELARLLANEYQPERTIIFVAFTGEESGLRGSKYFINNLKRISKSKIIGMINLDTVGRLDKNKILIINSSSASEWKHIAMGIGFVTGIDYELVSQDLDASDQVSFIEAGIPAIQLFSGPTHDYHRPSDTADKIDVAGLVKIATFAREALVYLAERKDPMTFTGKKSEALEEEKGQRTRKVGTGIMPDFAFQGLGVRAAEVAADSPAAAAGLQKGDVIIRLGEAAVSDLKSYSDALKTYNPADTTTITFIHEGKEVTSKITLQAR
jgi:aminopeptidase N